MAATQTACALSEQAREILKSRAMAHIAFLAPDGRPHSTPVWVDLDDGALVMNTATERVKGHALQPGTPVALSATHPENPYEYVQVRGEVGERTTEGADEQIDRLARKYLGVETYPYRQPGEERVTIKIRVLETTGS